MCSWHIIEVLCFVETRGVEIIVTLKPIHCQMWLRWYVQGDHAWQEPAPPRDLSETGSQHGSPSNSFRGAKRAATPATSSPLLTKAHEEDSSEQHFFWALGRPRLPATQGLRAAASSACRRTSAQSSGIRKGWFIQSYNYPAIKIQNPISTKHLLEMPEDPPYLQNPLVEHARSPPCAAAQCRTSRASHPSPWRSTTTNNNINNIYIYI